LQEIRRALAAAGLAATYLRFVNLTSRLAFDPPEPYGKYIHLAPVIFTMWHGQHFMLPFARKARDYFYVNHHRYGGRAFETSFSTLSIYLVYLGGIGIFIGLMAAAGAAIIYLLERFKNFEHAPWLPLMAVAVYLPALTIASTFIRTLSFNLSINGTVFDGTSPGLPAAFCSGRGSRTLRADLARGPTLA